jgi:hypothetical protein
MNKLKVTRTTTTTIKEDLINRLPAWDEETHSSYRFLVCVTDIASRYVSATRPARMARNPVYGVGRNIPEISTKSPGPTCEGQFLAVIQTANSISWLTKSGSTIMRQRAIKDCY